MTAINIIELWPATDECCVCEDEVLMEYGLPMYESEIVPEDWPGEWGGFMACKRCWQMFTDVKEPLPVTEARRILNEESMAFGHA